MQNTINISRHKPKMNRLILMGNGFDLASGLPTHYNDFIVWYLKKVFKRACNEKKYEDPLVSISCRFNFDDTFARHSISLEGFIDHYYNTGFKSVMNEGPLKDLRPSTHFTNPFLVKMVPFMENLVTKCNALNWVDIENEYYEFLKAILEYGDEQKKQLEILNKSMTFLVSEMRLYFKSLQSPSVLPAFVNILRSPIFSQDLRTAKTSTPKEILVDHTHILNFNYTETAQKYVEKGYFPKGKVQVNYIHGRASDENKPIIFGFGDELDEKYHQLEISKINEYFTFIKSFGYLRTQSYHSLLRFINADNYQVIILGHSCGLSDRTMLNMLFKHQNCQSIKIYYYQDKEGYDNFTELTQEISRHFKDKEMLREKVVNFEFCEPMPQVTALQH